MLKRSKCVLLTICILFVGFVLISCSGRKNNLSDGSYKVKLMLEGGSGRATVEEDTELTVENGIGLLRVTWSSPYYDYMIVEGTKYLPVNEDGNSEFLIRVPKVGETFTVIADTLAMSKPHEITYELTVVLSDDLLVKSNDVLNNKKDTNNSDDVEAFINANFKHREIIANSYAKLFRIELLDDTNIFINVNNEDYYLILDENNQLNISKENPITILNKACNNIYVVGSASMDYFRVLEALNRVGYSSLNAKDWEIDQIAEYINEGKIKYAGKYSAPDYELLLSEECDLIVENTMIFHNPEILEKLRSLGFDVMIDLSGKEETALARMEWIKLYGYLLGKEELANELFEQQAQLMKHEDIAPGERKSIAFFYVTSTGMISVRENQSYISDMIRSAGGKYIFEGISDFDGTGSKVISVEAFYELAKDSDILIYNGTIDGKLTKISDLYEKNNIFSKFKAVMEDEVYCTNTGFYQSSMELGNITDEISKITNRNSDGMYIYKLENR